MNFMVRRIRVFGAVFGDRVGRWRWDQRCAAMDSGSQVVVREMRGESLSHSLIGTNPVRKLAVYLPAGYESSTQRYPVIYYLPSPLGQVRRRVLSRAGARNCWTAPLRRGRSAR